MMSPDIDYISRFPPFHNGQYHPVNRVVSVVNAKLIRSKLATVGESIMTGLELAVAAAEEGGVVPKIDGPGNFASEESKKDDDRDSSQKSSQTRAAPGDGVVTSFKVGQKVDARMPNGSWTVYNAEIKDVNDDGSYSVLYLIDVNEPW